MPRAIRVHAPGQVVHITHRCHNQEFLLKFKQDRDRYRYWLYEARSRYGFCVLNYMITSNHIHLLVKCINEPNIPASMQLVAGRTAQEYNRRKKRKGAYWEDRYHVSVVQVEDYLYRCFIYIDLNITARHELIPLDSQERNGLLAKLLTGPTKLPGAGLYLPVALSLTRLENQTCMMALPRTVPNSLSIAWPLSMFTARPMKSLAIPQTERDIELEDEMSTTGFNLIS